MWNRNIFSYKMHTSNDDILPLKCMELNCRIDFFRNHDHLSDEFQFATYNLCVISQTHCFQTYSEYKWKYITSLLDVNILNHAECCLFHDYESPCFILDDRLNATNAIATINCSTGLPFLWIKRFNFTCLENHFLCNSYMNSLFMWVILLTLLPFMHTYFSLLAKDGTWKTSWIIRQLLYLNIVLSITNFGGMLLLAIILTFL